MLSDHIQCRFHHVLFNFYHKQESKTTVRASLRKIQYFCFYYEFNLCSHVLKLTFNLQTFHTKRF